MVEIKHLRAFLAVVEAAHQGRASEALRIQQSTLSRQIAALEDKLGVSLFERSHSGMRLTAIGATFLVGVRRTLFEFDRATTFVARSGRIEFGHLTIGFLISLATGRQRELITGFAQQWKGIELDFVEGGREELLERLRNRQLDVIFLPGLREVTDAITLRLWTERFHIIVPEAHPLAGRSGIKWSDFVGEPLILRAYESAAEIQAFLASKLRSDADRLNVRQLSVSRESLINLVGMGQGIAIGTDACQGVYYPGVVFRPIEENDAVLPVSLAYMKENNNPVLTPFWSFAKQRGAEWGSEASS